MSVNLYSINRDWQRPTCIWINGDRGSAQIQNFDAYTAGGCGQGPIRVLASSVVVPTAVCMPTQYTSLQVIAPARTTYTSGSVAFLAPRANIALSNGSGACRHADLNRRKRSRSQRRLVWRFRGGP